LYPEVKIAVKNARITTIIKIKPMEIPPYVRVPKDTI